MTKVLRTVALSASIDKKLKRLSTKLETSRAKLMSKALSIGAQMPVLQKTPPSITIGQYKVVYKQTPYDNRYLHLFYQLEGQPYFSEQIKFNASQLEEVKALLMVHFLRDSDQLKTFFWRWEKFTDSIFKHDMYLNESDKS